MAALHIPVTPGLTESSPDTASFSALPPTPYTPLNRGARGQSVDNTTLFIGGLEKEGPNAWDEKKLHEVFGAYGKVEEVTVVKQGMLNLSSCVSALVLILSYPSREEDGLCVREIREPR